MTDQHIAILWDFDKTLISGYMQAPLFEHYGVDPIRFWDEVNALPGFHARDGGGEPLLSDFLYLNHILTYVRAGIFSGLNNAMLRHFGRGQRFAPGVPEVFDHVARMVSQHEAFGAGNIGVEHYVITTGLRQIVLGSAVAPYMRHVWGCEFLHRQAPPGFLQGTPPSNDSGEICDIGYVIDHTTKTRAVFEINKGVREKLGIDVNTNIPKERRRIPFENMIYIADGPSDIPSLSVVRQFGGATFGVYEPGSERDRRQAEELREQERVDSIGPADYRPQSETFSWLMHAVVEIGEKLARTPRLGGATSPSPPLPRHIYK